MICSCPHCKRSFNLEALKRPSKNYLMAQEIIRLVCEHMDVTEEQLLDKTRRKEITNARHIAITLILKWAGLNLAQTGKLFNRDHTTVISSKKKIDDVCFTKQDPYEDFRYLNLKSELLLFSEQLEPVQQAQ